jgi:hypothetical protein
MSMNFLQFISWKTAFMVDENWGGRDQHVNLLSVEHFAMPIYGGCKMGSMLGLMMECVSNVRFLISRQTSIRWGVQE